MVVSFVKGIAGGRRAAMRLVIDVHDIRQPGGLADQH